MRYWFVRLSDLSAVRLAFGWLSVCYRDGAMATQGLYRRSSEDRQSDSSLRGCRVYAELRVVLLRALDSGADPWWSALTDVDLHFPDPCKQRRWAQLSARERARWITGQFWSCTDITPPAVCRGLGMPPGSTYARVARRLRKSLDGRPS